MTSKVSGWQVWLLAIRIRTLPAAIAPVLVGSTLAWKDELFDGVAAVLCLLFALLIQIGTNFANDYYDYIKGADTEKRVGPVRAVASGLVRPETMRIAMYSVLLVAFTLGLSLIAWGGPWLLIIGVTSVLCAIAYTGGPYPLGYNGLGDVFVFVFFGLIAVGSTYYVQTGAVTGEVILWATGIGLLAANILVVNNYRDVESDREAGKRTLVVRFGKKFACMQYGVSLLVAMLIPLIHWVQGNSAWVLLPVILFPMAIIDAQRLKNSKTPSELIQLLGASGKLLALYALLLSIGLVLS